jgi:hypothetical protein
MHILPPAMILLLRPFAPLFSRRVWAHVQVLLAGAILAPAQRTVTAALRVMGLGQTPHFQRYHRVLNRAAWSALAVSRAPLRLLVAVFVPDGPLVVGVDETLERRTGAKIAAKEVYRDAVRSSHSHFVKATGLRWVSLMLLAPLPWANRVWTLPFLTALAPSERANAAAGKRHKALTDWAWQLLLIVRRWWPDRATYSLIENGLWPTSGGEIWGVREYNISWCVPRWRASATEYCPCVSSNCFPILSACVLTTSPSITKASSSPSAQPGVPLPVRFVAIARPVSTVTIGAVSLTAPVPDARSLSGSTSVASSVAPLRAHGPSSPSASPLSPRSALVALTVSGST